MPDPNDSPQSGISQTVGQGVKLEPNGIVAELAARQPRPLDRILAFLDVLLRFASLIVEPCHPLGGTGQVGDDEADTGMQFAGMPFHLGYHAPLPVPASGLIAEVGIKAQYMVRRAANGSRDKMADVNGGVKTGHVAASSNGQHHATAEGPIDKTALPISAPRRIRDKDHLRFVASQPCLVCGRSPGHAHHVRYAQPRALGRKVGDEKKWWKERQVDPILHAEQLWRERWDETAQQPSSPAEQGS